MNIDPKDIRIGDRVRVTDSREIVAKEINAAEGTIVADDGSIAGMTGTPHWPRTWELVERPKPEAKLGSVWVDPVDGAKLVALMHGKFAMATGHHIYDSAVDWTPDIIARLVPAEVLS